MLVRAGASSPSRARRASCLALAQVQYGVDALMQREYGAYISATEPDFNITLTFDLDSLPADAEARAELIRNVSLIKRNAMAAPFERAFEAQRKLEANPPADGEAGPSQLMSIHYRHVAPADMYGEAA